jgi:beta-lactamase regulating signal transducer with metallopeptidase domain
LKRKNVKLYNIIFPIWLLWLIPTTWIVVLPANFIIDVLFVVLTLKYLKVESIKPIAKSIIFKVWIFGFLADFIGTLLMLFSNRIDFDYNTPIGEWWYNNITNAVSYNPFTSIYAILWVTVCVVITAILIYIFNYRLVLRKSGLEDSQKKKLALSLAIFTAPYTFFIPTAWFY